MKALDGKYGQLVSMCNVCMPGGGGGGGGGGHVGLGHIDY